MSDVNSSLPIRTVTNGDAVVGISDGTIISQKLAVDSSGKISDKLNDGAGNEITSQVNGAARALDVGIAVSGTQVDPRSIRALTTGDQLTAFQGTSPWIGKDQADGPVSPGAAASFATLVALQYNAVAPTPASGQQLAMQSDSAGNLKVNLQTSIPAGAALIGAVNLDVGSIPVSNTNPVPVQVVSSPVGTPVNNYNTASAIAAGASSNHIYTITTSKTFNGKKIWASGSGRLKIEVRISPDGSTYSSLWVGFNSTSNPNITIDLDELVFLESGAGATVEVIRTNEEPLLAQDVYSTISGTEL